VRAAWEPPEAPELPGSVRIPDPMPRIQPKHRTRADASQPFMGLTVFDGAPSRIAPVC
jgi:hypothetical protein